MKGLKVVSILICICLLFSCFDKNTKAPGNEIDHEDIDTIITPATDNADSAITPMISPAAIIANNLSPDEIVTFAETLVGIPYKYASTDPAQGFDCSGFITYVFNHFKIAVPRSSVDFTNVGENIPVPDAKRGDLILFTGTDSTIRIVGHMGIVTENADSLRFIHSTSGRQYGVTITALGNYYKSRFVKVIRIF